jgi:branched-chain amino acid transport system ATP-binding protein
MKTINGERRIPRMLVIDSVTKTFGGLTAVHQVSFRVEPNQIVGLIGPNGAGKTTLFNLISGFIPPSSGKITFLDTDITNRQVHDIAEMGMIRTFQHTSIFPQLTVLDNVLTGMHLELRTHFFSAFFRMKSFQKKEKLSLQKGREILALLGMLDKQNHLAKNLAYGDQRRLEIALALAANPRLLLLDEPAAGMNEKESADLVSVLRQLKAQGLTILIVEHDMKVVMNICDSIVVLAEGKKIAEGTPESVRENPLVIETYLGTDDFSEGGMALA